MGRISNRTPEQIEAFKDTYKRTGNIYQSKLAAGYTEAVARQGFDSLPKDLQAIVAEGGRKYIELGRSITAQDQEALVRGRLLANAMDGKDSAVNSLKLLGQDKRVNMFVADSIAGVVVIEAPRALPQADNLPVLDAEVIEPKQLPEKSSD